jgi:threonine/homoserine/homoserine lactone efflux protein
MGLASLVLANEKVFTILQLIGAIVLILLSFNMIFHSPLKISNQYVVSGRQGFIEGFMISFLNPKILVFFLAVFSQFINQEITNYNRFIIGFLAGIIDITWYVLVAVALSGTRLIERFKANKRLVDRSIGLALFFLAIILIIRTLKIEIFQGLGVVANG